MVVLEDRGKVWGVGEERYAVKGGKRGDVPKEDVKFLGEKQTRYEKKNWSSVMLINCAKCKALTPELVNRASGLELHQFKWLESDNLIGELPRQGTHLVGYDEPGAPASLVHFTTGRPYFNEYREAEYAKEWFATK